MADYRSMYLRLADEVERALDILDSRRNAEQQVFLTKAMLAAALQDCEDMYVETEEAQKPPAGGFLLIFSMIASSHKIINADVKIICDTNQFSDSWFSFSVFIATDRILRHIQIQCHF